MFGVVLFFCKIVVKLGNRIFCVDEFFFNLDYEMKLRYLKYGLDRRFLNNRDINKVYIL